VRGCGGDKPASAQCHNGTDGLHRRWPSRARPKNARWAGSLPGGRRSLAAAV